jgi:hypothetical protein
LCLLELVVEGNIEVSGTGRRKGKKPAAGWSLRRENVLEIER